MSVDGKDHPELISMAIAAFVAVVSIAALALLDFRPGHSQSDADGMITSAVLSRAGAIATPSEKPIDIAAPETIAASAPGGYR
jgi:hypothetical protein